MEKKFSKHIALGSIIIGLLAFGFSERAMAEYCQDKCVRHIPNCYANPVKACQDVQKSMCDDERKKAPPECKKCWPPSPHKNDKEFIEKYDEHLIIPKEDVEDKM